MCGGTSDMYDRMDRGRVYPRVCGGTLTIYDDVGKLAGLSPRVRGNPQGATGVGVGVGSIPACAGEPLRGRGRRSRRTVYPRVCGGTDGPVFCHDLPRGLSPRVRGNLNHVGVQRVVSRSIPACAGEPALRY